MRFFDAAHQLHFWSVCWLAALAAVAVHTLLACTAATATTAATTFLASAHTVVEDFGDTSDTNEDVDDSLNHWPSANEHVHNV